MQAEGRSNIFDALEKYMEEQNQKLEKLTSKVTSMSAKISSMSNEISSVKSSKETREKKTVAQRHQMVSGSLVLLLYIGLDLSLGCKS